MYLGGRCEGERRKGGRGRGEKKYACPISLFFWETPYAGKRSSWLVRHGEVDWCLSINCKSILFIPFLSSLLELERLGMSRVLRIEKVKAISTLVIRTRFARITKTYTTFTSCQNAAFSNTFFFFFWRVDYALEILCFDWIRLLGSLFLSEVPQDLEQMWF